MKKKIFAGSINQETNSFSPIPTRCADFHVVRGMDMVERFPALSEFISAGFELAPSIGAAAIPGGTLPLEDYRQLAGELLSRVPLDGSLGGVWLDLHGALNVEFIGSGEALLVSMIRDRIGPDVPISVAMDMHANHACALPELANIICGYRTAPHTDVGETQIRSARLLMRAIGEKALPWCEMIRIPMLLPGELCVTGSGPGKQIAGRLPEIEDRHGVWCASFFAGMPWVDCPQNGASALVVGTGDRERGAAAARELARMVWDLRDSFAYQAPALPPAQAVAYAVSRGEGPVFISDSGDNVTAGATGDNAFLLDLLIKNRVERALLAGIADPPAVAACARAGLGGSVSLSLGGGANSRSEKTRADGIVVRLRKDGNGAADGAVLRTPGIDVMISIRREFVVSVEDIVSFGLNPLDYHIVAVKLGYLFPGLSAIARDCVMALTPGVSSLNLRELPYREIQRPMHPLDAFEWDIPRSGPVTVPGPPPTCRGPERTP